MYYKSLKEKLSRIRQKLQEGTVRQWARLKEKASALVSRSRDKASGRSAQERSFPFRSVGKTSGDRHKRNIFLLPPFKKDAAGQKTTPKDAKNPARATRRYLTFAGVYLVGVLLLLFFVLARIGFQPSPQLPGMERGIVKESTDQVKEGEKNTGRQEDAEAEEDALLQWDAVDVPLFRQDRTGEDSSETEGAAEKTAEEEEEKAPPRVAVGDASVPAREWDTDQPGAVTGEEKAPSLPAASPPLRGWYLKEGFGEHSSQEIPSGGELHRISRGVLLQGPPGAEISALWDGKVIGIHKTRSENALVSVLLEHENKSRSLYSFNGEARVPENTRVRSGQTIGQLPGEEVAKSVPNEEGEEASCWREGSLLYLEVRHKDGFVDPLQFIPAWN